MWKVLLILPLVLFSSSARAQAPTTFAGAGSAQETTLSVHRGGHDRDGGHRRGGDYRRGGRRDRDHHGDGQRHRRGRGHVRWWITLGGC